MADTRSFDLYFGNRGPLPGGTSIAGDELLILRGGTVFRALPSTDYAYSSMDANAVETPITTQGVWVPLGGVLVQGLSSTTFSFAANEFTYIGINHARPSSISAAVSVSKAGQGNEIYEVGIFINAALAGTGMTTSTVGGSVGFARTSLPHPLQTNDVIDIRLRSINGTAPVVALNAQFIIS